MNFGSDSAGMKSAGKDFDPTKLWSKYGVKYVPSRINKKSAKQCTTDVKKGDKVREMSEKQ